MRVCRLIHSERLSNMNVERTSVDQTIYFFNDLRIGRTIIALNFDGRASLRFGLDAVRISNAPAIPDS